ncbi:MFS domain-containing protein [Fusarium sp. Ph1]|nr:MFS domain-containing protein [Fusarium sp. Ph1]
MIITRILLGALETPVAPGNFLIMTMWYTREEQPAGAGLFYTAQVWDLVKDSKTWLMFLFHVWVSIPNGGLTNFSPLILNGLGYSSQRSTLLMMPSGVIQTLSSYVCNFGVYFCIRRFPNLQLRGAFVIGGLGVGLIVTVFLYTLPTDAYVNWLLALYWFYVYLGSYIVSLRLNSANAAGHTQKFFKVNQASLYSLGMDATLTSFVLRIITISFYMIYCWNENRRRNKIDDRADQRVHMDTGFNDVTDQENVHFRYVW